MQALAQAQMRRFQRLVELVEAVFVVTARQITMQGLQHQLDALEAGVEGSQLALGSHVIEKLRVAGVALGGLGFDVLQNRVGGFVGQLQAAAEIDELRRIASICHRVRVRVSHRWPVLVCHELLNVAFALRGGGSTGRGLEDELENFERVRVLRGGHGDAECVSGWESNLIARSERMLRKVLVGGTYFAGREANLVIDSDLEDRAGGFHLYNGRTAQVPVGIVTVSKSQAVDVPVALVVCRAIIQEASDASTLVSGQNMLPEPLN